MKILHILLSITVLCISCGITFQVSAQKSKFVASKTPSVTMAMDIQKSIMVPLQALEKKNANPLIKELADITKDLHKLALNKVAVKYDTFLNARKSFEPGMLASEFKFAYLESWIAMTSKRVRKIGDYKGRLEKIQDRLSAFDKKLDALKGADDALRAQLEDYSGKLKEKIIMTNEWMATSSTLFTNELNKLKSREKAFKSAGVPRA